MTEKLLKCPFCGSKSVRLESVSLGGMANVTCNDCGVEGPCRYTDADAITAWNQRPQSDLTREGVARLAAIKRGPSYADAVLDAYGYHPVGQFYDDLDAILAMVPGGGEESAFRDGFRAGLRGNPIADDDEQEDEAWHKYAGLPSAPKEGDQ